EIDLGDFQPKKKAVVYEINGPEIGAQNSFSEPGNVKTVEKPFSEAASDFTYEFPAHSVTLIKLMRA
ncbi:MAG: hypothetical protein HQ583_02895, partial [Candidatus Abyssubacteria bacterium]|nr:hypothetical protein [Candidatus Abyssubacteria bacterium]